MKTTFQFPIAFLKAALVTAAKDDIRYYLNGVQLERQGAGVVAIGCDGHRLMALYEPAADGEPFPDFAPVIIGRSHLENAIKAHTLGKHIPFLGIELEEIARDSRDDETRKLRAVTLCANGAGLRITENEVDGKFPDWRKVIPARDREYQVAQSYTWESHGETRREIPGAPMGFDARYLGDFAKVLDILSGTKRKAAGITLLTHRNSPARVDLGRDDVLAVLMGINGTEPGTHDWFYGAPAVDVDADKVAA